LEDQYKIVKKETNTSQVCQFGDMSISNLKVADFQGGKKGKKAMTAAMYYHYEVLHDYEVFPSTCGNDAVPAEDVPIVILQKRLQAATNVDDKEAINQQLHDLMRKRKTMIDTTLKIITHVTGDSGSTNKVLRANKELVNFECYNDIVDSFHTNCYNLSCNDYALRQVNHFANMCEMGYSKKDILQAIAKVCTHQPICGIY
jgi:legumain